MIRGGLDIIVGIAEKPSIAKRIAHILANHGDIAVEQSPSKYNRVFRFQQNGNEFAITSVLGHVYRNDFPAKYNKWSRWSK